VFQKMVVNMAVEEPPAIMDLFCMFHALILARDLVLMVKDLNKYCVINSKLQRQWKPVIQRCTPVAARA
jgi:hypothetical protein